MSKSLGNSPDPLDLIEKFGADGVRVGLLLSASAGICSMKNCVTKKKVYQ
jgi:valyl-tRNA synthetase